MTINIKQTLLLRAVKLLHGKEKLAGVLGVSEPMLDTWISGAVEMPELMLPRLSAILNKAGDQTRAGFETAGGCSFVDSRKKTPARLAPAGV